MIAKYISFLSLTKINKKCIHVYLVTFKIYFPVEKQKHAYIHCTIFDEVPRCELSTHNMSLQNECCTIQRTLFITISKLRRVQHSYGIVYNIVHAY